MFAGEVIQADGVGVYQVQLANGHTLVAFGDDQPSSGQNVLVEMTSYEMRGWRIKRRP